MLSALQLIPIRIIYAVHNHWTSLKVLSGNRRYELSNYLRATNMFNTDDFTILFSSRL